jgi:hypothetical protein
MDTERNELSDLASDIKVTAADVAADAARVAEIEKTKAGLPANDPRLPELAKESEELAARMALTTKVETALVGKAQPKR